MWKCENVVMNEVFVGKERIYVGTRSVGNVLVFNKSSMQLSDVISFEEHRKQNPGRTYNVYSIVETSPSRLLLGTDGPPFLLDVSKNHLEEIYPPGWSF